MEGKHCVSRHLAHFHHECPHSLDRLCFVETSSMRRQMRAATDGWRDACAEILTQSRPRKQRDSRRTTLNQTPQAPKTSLDRAGASSNRCHSTKRTLLRCRVRHVPSRQNRGQCDYELFRLAHRPYMCYSRKLSQTAWHIPDRWSCSRLAKRVAE